MQPGLSPLVPTSTSAFETIECDVDADGSQDFNPQVLKFNAEESRLVLPLLAWAKSIPVHWYEADDFSKACVFCWTTERGCPLCRGRLKPQVDVYVPVIDLGPRLPGFLRMEKRGGRARASGLGGGQSLYSQITLFHQGAHPDNTGLRITKLMTGTYAATAVPLTLSDLPPSTLIERFTAHLAQPLTEVLGGFVRFEQPADLMEVASIQRLVSLGERG